MSDTQFDDTDEQQEDVGDWQFSPEVLDVVDESQVSPEARDVVDESPVSPEVRDVVDDLLTPDEDAIGEVAPSQDCQDVEHPEDPSSACDDTKAVQEAEERRVYKAYMAEKEAIKAEEQRGHHRAYQAEQQGRLWPASAAGQCCQLIQEARRRDIAKPAFLTSDSVRLTWESHKRSRTIDMISDDDSDKVPESPGIRIGESSSSGLVRDSAGNAAPICLTHRSYGSVPITPSPAAMAKGRAAKPTWKPFEGELFGGPADEQ
jgi:hypothetical protein